MREINWLICPIPRYSYSSYWTNATSFWNGCNCFCCIRLLFSQLGMSILAWTTAHSSPVAFILQCTRLRMRLPRLSSLILCSHSACAGSFLASRLCSVFARICKCPEMPSFLCFILWSYCACAGSFLASRLCSVFARICKCPEMPSFLCFILWSYCACARLISCQSSLFIFAHTICKCPVMPSLFVFHSMVLLRMRQAHFSPVVFVHFCAYCLQMPWNAFLFCFNLWSYCACQAHFSPVVFVHFFRILSANALKLLFFCFILWSYCACARPISRQSSLFIFARIICKFPGLPLFFWFCGLTAHVPPAHFSPVVFVHFYARICKCPEMPCLFCFSLRSYCACVRLVSRQSSLFIFSRISKSSLFSFAYLQMPGNIFLFQSYCACAKLICRQSSLFIFACICNSFVCFILWSYCACARLISRQSSLFIFCAYLQFLFYVSFCGLTAHAPGSFREFPWRRRSTASHIMLRTRLFILPRRLRS